VFKFRATKKRDMVVPSIRITKPTEELVGIVQGYPATDIEERMYIAFLHNKILDEDIEFQPSYLAGRNLPGEIRPDFATYDEALIKVWFADADYWHRSGEQKRKDETNDAILMQRMEGRIQFPIRISGEDLETQEDADRSVGEYV